MTVRTIVLTYNTASRTLTASSDTIGSTGDVSSTRFSFTPDTGDVADVVFCIAMTYLRSGRLDNPFVRIGSDHYAPIPGAIMSRLKDDEVDIYLKLTHADGTVETSNRLTMKVVTIGNTPSEADSTGALMIRGSSWEWQSEQSYDLGAVASKGQYVYVSTCNGNTGHDPSEAGTTYWASVTGAQGPQGPQGPTGQTGSQGPPGPPLDIKHIYASYNEMQADFDNPTYEYADMVLISSNVEDPYNSQIYTHGTTAWVFFTDMSGAQGIQGPKGDTGDAGSPGTPFTISKTYSSTSAMESDYESVTSGAFVVISNDSTTNGYLFRRENVASPVSPSTAHFLFIVSMAGPRGADGEPGEPGPAGTGVPLGGQTDYILAKNSNADYDFKWVAQGTAPVTSVNTKQGVVVLNTDDIAEGSSNKYMTAAQSTKLAGIASGAEVNVQSDWAETNTSSDAYIQNKPTIPDQLSDLSDDATHRLVTDTQISSWTAKQSALSFDNAPASGSNNPVTSGGIYTAIQTAIASAVRPMGSCTAAELAQKTGMAVGDMWNVTTEFVIGDVTYPAGTNVIWATGNHWDPMMGVVDLSGLVPKTTKVNNNALTGDITLDADDIGDGSSKVMMTSAERTKLSGIATGAEVNVQSDWNATSGDAYILNKPTIPTDTAELTNGAGYVTSSYHDSTKENTLNADQKRKMTISTDDPTGGSDGDIWLKYTA